MKERTCSKKVGTATFVRIVRFERVAKIRGGMKRFKGDLK